MRVFLPTLASVLALGGGLAACGVDDPAPAGDGRSGAERALGAEMDETLAGAPAPLAALHRQANELLDGGADAFRRRLDALRGHPVVVNKWASWCGPCRDEFPHFQSQALERGKEIAFIGVDANDNDSNAARFLREHPVPYPSYKDPDLEVSRVFSGVVAFPTTAFYDSDGELAYVKQGVYPDEESLVADIELHAR